MVSLAETKEFAETVGEKGWKTSSCCPAFVDYVSKNYPEYMDHVSTVVSPMVAIARAIREKDKKAKIIFIGPCTAKKVEIRQEDLRDSVDYVLTFEELRAVFDAREMELDTFDEFRAGEPSSFGRIFARTGGVAESVCRVAKLEGVETEIKPIRCNGIEECIKAMKMASFGRLDANFIEGMACRYGCTGGAASISHDMKGIEQINSFGREAVTDNPAEGIRGYNMGNVEMERIYAKEQPEEPAAVLQVAGKGYTLSFSVTNEQAKKVQVGDTAELQNAWYYDDVQAILAAIKPDPDSPGQKKLLEFDVTGTSIQEGQSLSVSIGQRSAEYELVVPNSAVREDNNGKFILIVESKSSPLRTRYIASRVDVEVLASDDNNTAISAGLYGYEYVITTSTKPVEAGKQVRLNES